MKQVQPNMLIVSRRANISTLSLFSVFVISHHTLLAELPMETLVIIRMKNTICIMTSCADMPDVYGKTQHLKSKSKARTRLSSGWQYDSNARKACHGNELSGKVFFIIQNTKHKIGIGTSIIVQKLMEKSRDRDDEDMVSPSLTRDQLGDTLAELEASENSQRNMLLRKVSELYDKLERQLEECIQLKEQNHELKKQLEMRSRERQDSIFQQNDRNLFNMFMEKITELQQQNTRLKISGGDSQFSSLSNSSRLLTQSPRTVLPKSPLSKTPTYSILRHPMASRQNIEPCVSPNGRIRSSIDQMWHSAQRQTVFSKLK